MKTHLIMLDTPVIVSDEEIRSKDWYITNLLNIYQETERMFEDDEGKPRFHYPQYKKIIAGIEGLPSIDWNGLEEEFGWVDVEKLAKSLYLMEEGNWQMNSITSEKRRAFDEGFKKAQSLNEKFSLEDMKRVAKISFGLYRNNELDDEELEVEFERVFKNNIEAIQQPKVFEIEIEMYSCPKDPGYCYDKCLNECNPKITNNSIKILRKL